MNNGIKLKKIFLIAAIIVSSYALATGGSANLGATRLVADGNGKDGRGIPNWRSKGQPDFTDAKWQKSRTDAQLIDVTKNGKGKYMPKSKMSDEEIAAVVARIRAFGKK